MILNALPTAMVVPAGFTVRVDGVERSFDECVGHFREVCGAAKRGRRAAVEREVKCGAFLVACQAAMPRGVWGRFLQRIEVNRKTARRMVVLAVKFGARGGGGVVDEAKVAAAVDRWNSTHPVGDPLHVEVGNVCVQRLQQMVGLRKVGKPQSKNELSGTARSHFVGGAEHTSNSLPLGVGAHNAPASFEAGIGHRASGIGADGGAGTFSLSPGTPVVPAVKDRGAGFDGRHSAFGIRHSGQGGTQAQMSLADEYEAVQAERVRLEAMLAEIAELVQVSGGGGVDVRGALARIGGDVEGLLRSVRGS